VQLVADGAVHGQVAGAQGVGLADHVQVGAVVADAPADAADGDLPELRTGHVQRVGDGHGSIEADARQHVPHVAGVHVVAVQNQLQEQPIQTQARLHGASAFEGLEGRARRSVQEVDHVAQTGCPRLAHLFGRRGRVAGADHDALGAELARELAAGLPVVGHDVGQAYGPTVLDLFEGLDGGRKHELRVLGAGHARGDEGPLQQAAQQAGAGAVPGCGGFVGT